jgi:hypothetical protein
MSSDLIRTARYEWGQFGRCVPGNLFLQCFELDGATDYSGVGRLVAAGFSLGIMSTIL